jgi:hypothetical protein
MFGRDITVKQLVRMVQSSIQLEHKDGSVANALKSVTLTEKLDAATVEDLAGRGAGPKTVKELYRLLAESAKLPDARPIVEAKRPTIPPPSPEEQERIITEVRDFALNYLKGLPDFICTQVTRRFYDPSGMEFWHKADTVTAKLTYFEQKEDYKVILINNRPVTMEMQELDGSTSTGEFGSMMREIFEPSSDATFVWERWGKLRGRVCHVYNYFVRQEKSKWSISFERRIRTVPAYRGLIFVDRDTQMVSRITLEAVNIDPTFPVQEANTTLDYDLVKLTVSDAEFMLPLKSEMRMRQGRLLVKNEVEFRLYRKFGAEATISFDTPDSLPAEMFAEEPQAEPVELQP